MSNDKNPVRILQCVSNMDRAGIETMLMNFYRNIDRDKIQFDFLVNKSKKGDYDDEITSLGGKIYVSPGLNPLKFFRYQKFIKDLFKNHPEYKIIHCQNEAMGFYALKGAKDCNIPVRISHSHNTTTRLDFKYPIKIFCKNKLKKYANVFVACSKAAGNYLFDEDVKVINNAIDSNKFIYNQSKRKEIRKKYDIEGKYVLGHVGRFEPQKNHDFLIDIFNDYLKINDNSVLLLVGEGSLMCKIKEKVERLGIKDKVIFTGNISNVNEMYQAMDLFLLPSFHEGLPVVGVEAQASGLKCLFSNKITTETNLTGNVDFLDINMTNSWIKKIDDYRKYERKNMKDILIEKNYDIISAANNLTQFYFELLEEYNYENSNDRP